MIKQANPGVRALRKIIGMTQGEFAEMLGVSKDAVTSWETGRNQLSATFARRIALVTGVDGKLLHMGVSVPMVGPFGGEPRVYTAEDFKRHRQTDWGGSNETSARQQLELCHETMELLFMAAAQTGGERVRHRLPGLVDSFIQWSESAREDFKLGPEVDEELGKRRRRVGMTQEYRDWRAMARGNAAGLAAAGFKDDPAKGDLEQLRLELEVVPEWMPGRSMKWPKPAKFKMTEDQEQIRDT